jgi:predicted dehydrogenase
MTYQKTLNIGFIGGGLTSAVGYAHYCASHLDGRWKLIAGAFSKNPDTNTATAKKYGLTKSQTYTDWLTLLEREKDKLDAIVILTPTPDHERMVIKAIAHGIAVICEKALTDSVSSCQRIINTVEEYKGFLAITYNYSGYPMLRELKKLIDLGELGNIKHIQVEMPQEGFSRLLANGEKPCPQAWRLHDGEIPTIYLDLSVHLHHLVHFLTQLSPLSTIADQNTFGWFDDIIDDASALVKYSNNVKCQYWVSKTALGYKNGMRIRLYGDKAAAEWLQTEPETLTISHINGKKEIIERGGICELANDLRYNRFKPGHPSGFIEAFANLYNDLADSVISFKQGITDENAKLYGTEPTLEGLKMLNAMVASVKSERWEKI